MQKRCRYKRETRDSIALKKIRNYAGVSQRELAKLMGTTQSLINHHENGRTDNSEEFIKKAMKALNFSYEDFEKIRDGSDASVELYHSCNSIIRDLPPSKIEFVHKLLLNL